jgi:hypothetical protein
MADRGSIEIVTLVYEPQGGGDRTQISFDPEQNGVCGVRQDVLLANDDATIALETVDPALTNAKVFSAQLSIVYPNGGVELTPAIEFGGEIGMISWSRIQIALAASNETGDANSNAPFVMAKLYHPNPSAKP